MTCKTTAVAALLALGCLTIPQPDATAQVTTTPCQHPVVLIHDMGRDKSEFDSLSAVLRATGYCPSTFTYGTTAATPLLSNADTTVAGLSAIEDAATELDRFVASLPHRVESFVAHGSGSLVAQYFIQHHARGRSVRELVAIGPIWNGTNFAELGTLEQLSRAAGTYDAVLALETPLLDPYCAGCRQLVAGSAFLSTLHREGLPTAQVAYTNIISLSDTLVSPALSAQVPGMHSLIVQDASPGDSVDHFHLAENPTVQLLTVETLSASDSLTYDQGVSPADDTPTDR